MTRAYLVAGRLGEESADFMRRAALLGRPRFENLSTEQARQLYEETCRANGFAIATEVTVEDNAIPTQAFRLRLYRPKQPRSDACIVFVHGGGWVLGGLETHDPICRRLAVETGSTVAAVDYRLAPENPAPAAFDDCLAALEFVRRSANSLRVDPENIALVGDSAGGALAASVAIACARDAVPLRAQVLIYPVTDLLEESAGYGRAATGGMLSAATMRWFKNLYATTFQIRSDWRVSPARSAGLDGVAPALVITAHHDPLCEEGIDYARSLQAAGVPTTLVHLGEHMHGFLTLGGTITSACLPLSYASAFLRQMLDRHSGLTSTVQGQD